MRNLLLLPLLMFFFSACGNDDEPYRLPFEEFPQIKLIFTYTDKDGNDMLDPSNPECVLNERTYVLYKGEEYYLNKPYEKNPNGDDTGHVSFQGLVRSQIEGGRYALIFGNLDGSAYYRDEKLSIAWGDGRELAMTIYSMWTYSDNGMPNFYRVYKVTGEVVAENTVTPIINGVYKEMTFE